MRNDNLDLAQSSGSGSESSPSWASATNPRGSTFTFGFGQNNPIDNLSTQFAAKLRATKSSEVLTTETSEERSFASTSASSTSSHNFHILPSSKKGQKYDSGERITSGHAFSAGTEDKKLSKESKIAKFLRRTQSAQDNQAAGSSTSSSRVGGEDCKGPTLEKIDDTEEDSQPRSKSNKGTDMKFRLGFLKRRHTEGTINSSVRPQPEEAQRWANSFSDLMQSKYGQALFKAFLQREFSEENIEFWLAVEDYRKTRQNKLNSKAQKIYNEFVIAQAPKEVNLDALTKEAVVSKLAQPTPNTFDQAQKRVQGLLEADAYARFLKSELYMELLHPENYQPSS